MNKYINMFFAASILAVGLVSCNDGEGLQEIVPEEYHKMLYVKENGTQNVTLYNVGENVSYTFTVCKGGSDPSLTATAKVTVVDPATDVECQELATQENVQYKGIPADAYTLSNTDLEYSSGETWKQVTVTVDPQKVQNTMDGLTVNSGDLPVVWMLPLEVTSETDSVSSERNRYIIEIDDVLTPQIGFTKTSEQYLVIDGFDDGRTATLDFALNMVYEKWGDFTCEFEVVDDYELEEGKTLLPEGSYTFDSSVTFNAQTSVNSSLTVTIDESADLQNNEYVLPIRMKSVSPSVEISENNSVCVLNISSAVAEKLDRTGWANGSEACCVGDQSWISISNLFQIPINTQCWWSEFSASGCKEYTTENEGGHTTKHPSRLDVAQDVPMDFLHWIIVDMQKECYVTSVSLYGLKNNERSYITKGEFYLGSDRSLFTDIEHPEVWTHIGSFSGFKDPSAFAEQNFPVDKLAKGRYLMIYFTGSAHVNGEINLAEIEVTGVPVGE